MSKPAITDVWMRNASRLLGRAFFWLRGLRGRGDIALIDRSLQEEQTEAFIHSQTAVFKLALRNVLRQKIRTAMTLAAIIFGVIGLVLSGGFFQGIFI